MVKDNIDFCPLEYFSCFTDNKSLKVSWQGNISDKDIGVCIGWIGSMVKTLSVKTLLIDSSNLKGSDFGLNWKIIENSWQSFCENGGKKIVVINTLRMPKYMEEEYTSAIKDYGIPIELEFKGKIAE